MRLELVVWYVHRRTLIGCWRQLRSLAGQRGLLLHMGCGDVIRPGWLNVDIHPAADLRLDVRRRWPFSDGSAAIVFAEHLFEHLPWPGDADHFLAEARRVLGPDGMLRLSVPDMARHAQAYLEHDGGFRRSFAPFLPSYATTWGDALNHHFRQYGEHHYAYDAETLAARLTGAGFADPEVVSPDHEYEQPLRDFESLVMTARRP